MLPIDSKLNFFEMLGIDKSYDINTNKLISQYLKKQVQYHPDKFAGALQPEKEIAQANSAVINKAFETLKDPLKRAEYLLHLNGHSISKIKVSSDLLEQSWNWREELEECDTKEKINNLYDTIMKLYNDYFLELGSYFVNNDYDTALNLYIAIKFIKRFLDEINQKSEHNTL